MEASVPKIMQTEVRCEHGHLGAVVFRDAVAIKLRDGCTVRVNWPLVRVELVKKLN